VRADGVVAKAGGKVVKNVAGYDFGKLLTGSYGTLGIVTEVVVRLHPLPAARRFVTVETTDQQVAEVLAAVVGSQLVPSAVEVDRAGDGPLTVTVLLEGVEAGVAGRAEAAAGLLGAGAAATSEPPAGFTGYPFGAGDTGLKVTTTLRGVPSLLRAARQLSDRHGLDLRVRGSAGGVLYAGLPSGTTARAATAVVAGLRATAAAHSGSVTVLTAPPDVREALDIWGPVPGLELMRRVKHELDPGHRLSPGRFVGGI
jgi:glycolate oxidase FAD binding subunit